MTFCFAVHEILRHQNLLLRRQHCQYGSTHRKKRKKFFAIATKVFLVTFRVSRRRREMYCSHPRMCLSVCLSLAACLHYCADPDVTWGSGREYPLVLHYWADLQSRHGLRCYGNITRMRHVNEYMLLLALCIVEILNTCVHILL